jgi:uncharacterized SAM-binding protein YcdF (DUF218 family)
MICVEPMAPPPPDQHLAAAASIPLHGVTCLVIFGAAVRADGSPSGSLQRRCDTALRAGRDLGSPLYLATGGVGEHGPAEAQVMRNILAAAGVCAQRILVETESRDTLQSVRHCTHLLRQRDDVRQLLVCSSSYHNPRCVLLLRAAGFRCDAARSPSDRPYLGWGKWLRYSLKELIATPWDLSILLALKIAGRI